MTTVYGPNRLPQTRSGLVGGASSAVSDSYTTAEFWSQEQRNLFQKWAYDFPNYSESYTSPYFDYFYTGQDIKVTIEGLPDDDHLPLFSLGYIIEQQKQPVYGYWSYTYDAMLRGTRIVSGAFSIATRSPHFLVTKIARAAEMRQRAFSSRNDLNVMHSLRGVGDDEANIKAYWSKHYDSNLDSGQQHLFSIHPPFNIIVKYGLQETSLAATNSNERASEFRLKYGSKPPMAMDTNERLVTNPIPEEDKQVLIENIELVNMTTQIDNEGSPLLETYSFLARDVRHLSSSAYSRPTQLQSGGAGGRPPLAT